MASQRNYLSTRNNSLSSFLLFLICLISISFSSCAKTSPNTGGGGNGGRGGNGGGGTAGPTLSSITLQPATVAIGAGETQQFDAMGTYSDGTTKDLTSTANWTSSRTSVATVESAGQATPGLATGVAGGNAKISAGLSGVTGTATLTVTSTTATITSIAVNPVSPSIAAGTSQQFYAIAHYSDNTNQDITIAADWSSSNQGQATVQTAGQSLPGLATGVAAGTVTISATSEGQTGSNKLFVTASNGDAVRIPLMDMTASQIYLRFQGGLYGKGSDT